MIGSRCGIGQSLPLAPLQREHCIPRGLRYGYSVYLAALTQHAPSLYGTRGGEHHHHHRHHQRSPDRPVALQGFNEISKQIFKKVPSIESLSHPR